MNFENEKKIALNKAFSKDKSKKGSIDVEILSTVTLINNSKDFYTTSSCAGRIMLFMESNIKKKNENDWLYLSHKPVKFVDIKSHLDNPPKETVWFRMEPPILHICARDMETAYRLLKIANNSGFRRSAILSFKKRIIVEIMFLEKLDTPISENNILLVDDAYLRILIKHANSRLKRTREKLKKFEKIFSLFSSRH